jgi:hypothetical protein
MKSPLGCFLTFWLMGLTVTAQPAAKISPVPNLVYRIDTSGQALNDSAMNTIYDSIATVSFRDVNIVYFKTDEERMLYYKYKSRIYKVLPYVKIAKQLYAEIKSEKENTKKREYRHYRKDVEKEMREKFEKELKNLSTSQGAMLFKLINRETHNNAYTMIKEIKGGVTAWFYQLVGKRWGYDLREDYDPEKEHLIEMIIKEMGPAYDVRL